MPGWIDYPTSTTPVPEFNRFFFIPHYALKERFAAIGQCLFPTPTHVWYGDTVIKGSGVITAITATQLTDANANPDEDGVGQGWGYPGDGSGLSYTNPWAKVTAAINGVPTDWALCIDDDPPQDGVRPRPSVVIKVRIESWDDFHLNFNSIQDYVTSGFVTSLASLVGKKYYIIKWTGGYFWHERFLEFTNDTTYSEGKVVSATSTTIQCQILNAQGTTFVKPSFKAAQVGKHILVRDTTGELRRVAITAVDGDTLTFATQVWTANVGADYIVVDATGRGYPGRPPTNPLTAHRGAIEGADGFSPAYRGHMPSADGSGLGAYVNAIKVPALTFCVPDANLLGCGLTCPNIYDTDFITDATPSDDQMLCGYPPDKIVSPHLWKTYRSVWAGMRYLANANYLAPVDYSGADAVPTYSTATWLAFAGINSTTSSVSAVDGDGSGISFGAVSLPYSPIDAEFSIVNDAGETYKVGTALLTTDESDHITGAVGEYTEDDVGNQIVFSFGPTCFIPREVERMFYGKTCFQPSTVFDEVSEQEIAVDPPTADNYADDGCQVGTWIKRPKSTRFIEPGPQGPVEGEEFGTPDEQRIFARYVGNQWCDRISPDSPACIIDYSDLFYVGQFEPNVEAARDAQKKGVVTASRTPASSFHLTDEDADFWDNKWHPKQPDMHVDEGTAGGGSSTTTMHDATKTSGAAFCWWDTANHFDASFSGPYVGFTIEFLMSGTDWDDEDAVIEKRLITSGDDSVVSVSWSSPLSATCQSKQYRIREPQSYELNRWEDRELVITDSDGVRHTTTIRGNDDNTLFFDSVGFTVTEGMSYSIREISTAVDGSHHEQKTGGVYEWTGTDWVPVSGADETRIGVAVAEDFVRWLPGNLPSYVKRYRFPLRGDAVGKTFFDEMKAAFNALVHVKHAANWTDKSGPDAESVPNYMHIGFDSRQTRVTEGSPVCPCAVDESQCYTSWSQVLADAHSLWGSATPITGGGRPLTLVSGGGNTCYSYSITRSFAWGIVSGFCTQLHAAVDFYAFTRLRLTPSFSTDPLPIEQDVEKPCGYDPDLAESRKLVFDDHGATGLIFKKWGLWNTTTQTEETVYSSDSLGDLSLPHDIADVPNGAFQVVCHPDDPMPTNCDELLGYQVSDECAVARNDVPGAFEFYGD
jgi:hypothetical protein